VDRDRNTWREVDRKENNRELHNTEIPPTFAVKGGERCHFIWFVQIGTNQYRSDCVMLEAGEIFWDLHRVNSHVAVNSVLMSPQIDEHKTVCICETSIFCGAVEFLARN
jgi:hypothetical protein